MSLSAKTAAASLWMVGGRLLSKSIDFVSLLVLARFLGPSEFGLVAIAMIAIQIVDMILEIPMAAAIGKAERLSDDVVSTAFTIALIRALAIAVLMAALAIPMANFYREPRLVALTLVLAISPAMRGLANPNLLTYSLNMDFRRDFAIDVFGKVFSLIVACAAAILTKSYWAIALGSISTTIFSTGLSYFLAPTKFSISLKEWRMFAPLLGWNSFAQVMQAVNWQLDRIALPRFISVASFGNYSNAANITSIPYQAIVQPILRPLLVAFAARNEEEAVQAGYLRASYTITAIVGPILIGVSVCARPIVEVILGATWAGVAPILCYMALISAITLPVIPMPALALSQGHAHLVSLKTFAELLAKAPAVFMLVGRYGIGGALVAQAISSLVMVVASMALVRRLTGLTLYRQWTHLTRPAVALLALAAVAHVIERGLYGRLHAIVVIALAAAAAAAVYVTLMVGLWWASGKRAGPEAMAFNLAQRLLSPKRSLAN